MLKKANVVFAAWFVFTALLGLFAACHRMVADTDLRLDFVGTLAVIVIGAYYLAKVPAQNRAKECATCLGLMYFSFAMREDTVSMPILFAIAIGMYIFEWTQWEKNSRNGDVEIYSRWMTYNILLFSFVLGGAVVLALKNLVVWAIPAIMSVLWLAMIVKLSLKLRD